MPKRIDVVERRRAIADAAISVIAERGLEGAGLREVARAAGVTTGAIAHYFQDKDEVLEAALEEVVRRTREKFDAAKTFGGAQDTATFLARVCQHLPLDAEARGEWRVWLAFWAQAMTVERLRAVHASYYDAFTDHTMGSLQLLARDKAPAELRSLADAVIAAVDGVGIRATLEPSLWPAERQRETIEQLLTPMLVRFRDADSASMLKGENSHAAD